MKTSIYLVRHAEAEGNVSGVFHGWTDSEITKKGHIQSKLLAERFRDVDIDTIYSSSLKRTFQTAEYIAKEKDLKIILSDELKEINGGDWEEKTWEEIFEKWPAEYNEWENSPNNHNMPNGESMIVFRQRAIAELDKIAEDNLGKSICIVTHGTLIKVLMCYFNDKNLDYMTNILWYDNTSVTIITKDSEGYEVIKEGQNDHLDTELSTIMNQEWWKKDKEKLGC